MKYWTVAEVNKLRVLYRRYTIRELVNCFDATHQQIKNALARYKITCGRTGCFPKNNIPWNKGIAHPHNSSTKFKMGHKPHNTRPQETGAFRVHTDKCGKRYLMYKVSNAKWVYYHRYIWGLKHSPIDPGMVVSFKDGDTFNFNLNNLALISRADNMKRNQNRVKAAQTLIEHTKLKRRIKIDYGVAI